MFAVLIEAEPHEKQWDAYCAKAKMLQSELERSPGFVDDIRYRSMMRTGWILSLSGWLDETAIVGGQARMRYDDAQWRDSIADYRLRFGEVTSDTSIPDAQKVAEKRL